MVAQGRSHHRFRVPSHKGAFDGFQSYPHNRSLSGQQKRMSYPSESVAIYHCKLRAVFCLAVASNVCVLSWIND